MRRILTLSFNALLIIVSLLFPGCDSNESIYNFQPKTYNEYYNALENTTIQIELVVNNKRAVCYYSNDSTTFVYTIKYQHSNEYGYIYNTKTNELYCMEDQKITKKELNDDAEETISKLYNASNFLFHLKYDFSKFEYINTVTVCNRNCNKYRFKENINGTLATFNVYIDQATGFCLKGVCVIDDETKIYFETKRFISEPNINNYFNAINEYEAKK